LSYPRTFVHLIQNHGFSGFLAFLKIKLGFTKAIKLTNIAHEIRLRPNSSDVTAFKYIFAHDDYDFSLEPEPEVIIDAGANIGLASIYFANRYPKARIIAIELAPSNFEVLLKNTRHYNQIQEVNAGLWHKNELLKFDDGGSNHWGYQVDNSIKGNSVSVESVTTSEIMNKFNIQKIDFFKIDIEGAEAEVFSGNYAEWLPMVRFMMIEFHDRMRPDSSQPIRSLLNEFGFKELEMVGENAVFVNKNFK
jgi:FkbM family methyltransferase